MVLFLRTAEALARYLSEKPQTRKSPGYWYRHAAQSLFCNLHSCTTALHCTAGCGVSTFLDDMRKDGYTGECVGIDYSPTAVRAMKKQFPKSKFPNFEFLEVDARDTPFADETFDFVIDKATTDGLLCKLVLYFLSLECLTQ